MSPIIEIKDATLSFGSNPVLQQVNVDASKNEIVVIIGPSGSGKSTLLRCMNQLEQPQSGDVRING